MKTDTVDVMASAVLAAQERERRKNKTIDKIIQMFAEEGYSLIEARYIYAGVLKRLESAPIKKD